MELLPAHIRSLLPNEVHVGFAEIQAALLDPSLSAPEQKELETITHPNRKREFLSARSLVRDLGKKAGAQGRMLIQKDRNGQPSAINGEKHYHLSIAHAGTYIACAISEIWAVGIDLEASDRVITPHLMKRMCHSREPDSIRSQPPLRIWTMKEALLKLEGCGLRGNMNDVRLKQMDELRYSGQFNDEKKAIICSFQHSQYWMAVAFRQPA